MARKSRRTKNSPKSVISFQRIVVVALPVVALLFFLLNTTSGRNVLGITDSNLLNLTKKSDEAGKPKTEQKKVLCNRVTAFNASAICERSDKEKTNNAFKTYSYTCEDGTTGSVVYKQEVTVSPTSGVTKCIPIEKAFEAARKLCNKKCKLSPTPTPTPIPEEGDIEGL